MSRKVCDDIDEATYGPPDYNLERVCHRMSFENEKARDEQNGGMA